MDNDDGADYSFQEYTKIWMNLIDRCGLFKVNDVTYSFFLELELSMYPLLRTSVESSTSYHKVLLCCCCFIHIFMNMPFVIKTMLLVVVRWSRIEQWASSFRHRFCTRITLLPKLS